MLMNSMKLEYFSIGSKCFYCSMFANISNAEMKVAFSNARIIAPKIVNLPSTIVKFNCFEEFLCI